MPIAKINDINLYYEVDGEGPWAIFVAGGGGTHLGWWRQVYALRNRYKCVTYDARGLGQTEGVEGAGQGDPDADLLALMDHLKIDKAFVNGHSAGGAPVSNLTQKHPDRVHALIMTCCAFGFQTAALSKWAAEMLAKFSAGKTIGDRVRPPDMAKDDPEYYFLGQEFGHLNSKVRPRDAKSYTARFGDGYIKMRDAPPGDFSKYKVPTLFVVGQYDELQVPWLIRATAEAIPHSMIVEIPGSGHGVPQEKPDIYNAALMAYMDRHDPRADGKAG